MKNTSILLNDHFQEFIDFQLSTGNYSSVSEVIRAALRLLEEREMKIQRLREEIQKGIDSGITKDFNFNSFLAEMNAEFEQETQSA